jgi:hypothetical protein
MIDRILRRLGLVRISSLKEEDVNRILVDYLYGQPENFTGDLARDTETVFKRNPVVKEFLDWTVLQDIKRFYTAQEAEQPLIRGAISRTRYLRTLCVTPEKVQSESQKFNLKRYINN